MVVIVTNTKIVILVIPPILYGLNFLMPPLVVLLFLSLHFPLILPFLKSFFLPCHYFPLFYLSLLQIPSLINEDWAQERAATSMRRESKDGQGQWIPLGCDHFLPIWTLISFS